MSPAKDARDEDETEFAFELTKPYSTVRIFTIKKPMKTSLFDSVFGFMGSRKS